MTAQAVLSQLGSLASELNEAELELILQRLPEVDAVEQARIFAESWKGSPLRSWMPFEKWLAKAPPKHQSGRSRPLTEYEIQQRVDHFRRLQVRAVVNEMRAEGREPHDPRKPWSEEEIREVERELVADYEDGLRRAAS